MDVAELAGILSRVVLGGVLLWAGIAKLQDRTWLLVGFASGFPYPVLVALPFVECTLGVLLLAQAYTKVAALGALGLLLLFSVVVGRELRQLDPQPCNCFGRSPNKPVSRWTLVRNLFLLALAGVGFWL